MVENSASHLCPVRCSEPIRSDQSIDESCAVKKMAANLEEAISGNHGREEETHAAEIIMLEESSKTQTELEKLERKFTSLARKFTFTMHFYGFFQDMNLLLGDTTASGGPPSSGSDSKDTTTTTTMTITSNRGRSGPRGSQQHQRAARRWWLRHLSKWASLALVVLANVTTIYFLAAHIIWELRRLDSRSSASSSLSLSLSSSSSSGRPQLVAADSVQPQQQQQQPQNSTATGATGTGGFTQALGWSVLKEFLDNIRRHLSRLFSLALTISWHVSCHRIELLFIDCRHYYSMFYKPRPIDHPQNHLKQTYQAQASSQVVVVDGSSSSCYSTTAMAAATATERAGQDKQPPPDNKEQLVALSKRSYELSQRIELYQANRRLYHLAHRRTNLTILLPLLHFMFNVISLSLFPSSTRRRPATELPFGITSNHSNPVLAFAGQAMDNFDSFHLSIHTAFHPIDHQIKKASSTGSAGAAADELLQTANLTTASSSASKLPAAAAAAAAVAGQMGANQSALYCFIELLVYSVYFQGPRIVCATCLSLILNIHYQCIRSLNRQLMTYIKRTHDKPMSPMDMISLVKQYDVVRVMHERIEQVFKWSIVQWFSLMFLNCLIHIFSFTESTSAYVVSANQNQNIQLQSIQQPQQLQPPGSPQSTIVQQQQQQQQQSSTSLVAVMVRLASMFFVCYSPYLIYTEAIKIESASNQMQVSMVRLSRRKEDPIAQAIEPDLFEPLYLSVGDYFHLSKKSMSSFMGAIVTFSVMFIGELALSKRSDFSLSTIRPPLSNFR